MKGNGKKKILIGVVTILFSLVLFSFIMISNAEEVTVVGTWDVSADDGASNVTATLYSDGRFVISGTGKMKGYITTSDRPYDNNRLSIKTAEIQNGVTSIGYGAFESCTSLSSIEIPSSVTSIGDCAFRECTSLSSIEIPNSVTSIGDYAFYKCTSLSSIEIPDNVTGIGILAFGSCTSLSGINVDMNNQKYSSEDGVLFDKEKTKLIQYPAGKENTEYKILISVKNIGIYAFSYCTSLSSIEIPEGVTSIGNYAFSYCTSLSSIEIPEGVTSIGNYAFEECSSLSNIEIPEGVTSIGSGAFESCTSLSNIEIPSSVTSIEYMTFYYCTSLTNVTIPSSVTSIGGWAFYKCTSLSSIEIPDSVTSIGSSAFYECASLSSIEIPEGVTSIGNEAFYRCTSLSGISVDTNNQKYSSEDGVLFDKEKTKLIQYPVGKENTEYKIQSSVTSIGRNAFDLCTSLSSIEIPEGVTSIGSSAFYGCSSLNSIEIPSSVTSIGRNAFDLCTSLSSIEIPEGVTSIERWAFSYCTSLTNVTIPSSVTSIGYYAFYGCESLSSINIPEGVTSIRDEAFYGCTSLTSITIPNSVTSIGNKAFYGARLTMAVATGSENMQNIELPEMIKRAMNEEDILYTANDFTLRACSLSEDKTKLVVASKIGASLEVTEGALDGLTVLVLPSGTITYSTRLWTKDNVTAIIHVADGETIQNNDGKNTYTFTENGTFTFQYLTAEGEEKEVTATVENIDKTAPTISSVAGNPTQWTKENVTLTVTAQDTGSGLASESYSFDGGVTWQAENTKTYTENTNGIVIKVKDKAGNIATYDSINITKIDKTAPTISSVAENPTQWTKDNVTLTVTAQDTGSGLASEAYSFDGGTTWQAENTKTYTENTNGIVIKIKDKLGNIAIYNSINITNIDKTAPTISSVAENPTQWTKENVTLTVTAQDTGSGLASEAYSFDGGVTWQAENTKTYTENTNGIVIKVKDKLGNIVTYDSINITKIDRTAPTMSGVAGNPTQWTKGNVTLTVTAQDTGSGLASEAYSFDGGTTWQASNQKTYTENTNGIVIKVKDKAGNIATYDSINITKIDKTAPTISSVAENPTQWTKDNVTLTVTAQDTGSGLASEAYSFDGGTTWQAENTKTYTENTNGIVIKIKDKLGNIAIYNSINITNIDKTAPTISSVAENPTQWTKENVTLTVTAQDTGSGLASEAYSFDGGVTWQAENTKTYTENTNGIVIKVKDKLGNIVTYDSINITKIDRTAPTMSGVAGNPTQWTKGNVTLTVTAQDTGSGLASEAYSFDGGTTWQASNQKTYTENTNGIVIKVKDKAGNIATYDSINITKIEKLTSIIISNAPNKTIYVEGQNFDATGMEVKANYNSQITQTITNYTIIDGENLKVGQTSVTISYTENEVTKTRTQAITVEEKLKANPKNYEATEENGIKYIENINPNTKIQGLIEDIETNGTIKIYKGDAEITDINSKMQTGMTIKITLGNQETSCTLVVKGDLDGDGEMGDIDLLRLVRYNAGLDTNLSGAYLKAADIYKDGACADNKDLLKIARVLAGLEDL